MAEAPLEIIVEFTSFPVISKMKNPAKVRDIIRARYKRAATAVGMIIAAKMRKMIQSGLDPKQSPFTSDAKRSTKPLVHTGRLFKAVTYAIDGEYSEQIRIGVMRTHAAANVARIVHEGATITVTPKMAVLFKVLHAATLGGRGGGGTVTSKRAREMLADYKGMFAPLKVGTVLTIPPRPFAKYVFEDSETKKIVEEQFSKALAETMKELMA